MSTNENIPASDQRNVDTAPVQAVAASDAPEPDITKAGRNLILALLVLMVGIGISWAFGANLYKSKLSEMAELRGGGIGSTPAVQVRARGAERATTSGTAELPDGSTVTWVPIAEGTSKLLADPSLLAGDPQYLEVEGGEVASLPALPSFEAVLDPSLAVVEADEEDDADADDAAAAELDDSEETADEANAETAEDDVEGEPEAAE